MKNKLLQTLLAAAALAGLADGARAQNTAFTYQGKLTDDCCPATGLYDLTFKVYDAATTGTQMGGTVSKTAVPVTNGLFAVSLDFGSGPFTGARRWLQIDARTNNPALTPVTLLPRTELTPTPYAVYASKAGTVTNGAIQASQLGAVGAPSAGQVLGYNGSSLVWQTPGASSGPWLLNGSSAYYTGGNVGIGRSDPPFALSVRGGAVPIAWERYVSGAQAGKTWGWEVDGAGTYVRNATDTTLPLAILNNGNVGIGTASPGATLDVAGNLQLTGPSRLMQFYSPGSYDFRLIAGGDFGTRSFSIVDSTAGSQDRLTINSAGNVGIGTADPQSRLHVAGGTAVFDHPGGAIRVVQTTGELNTDDLGIWNGGGNGGQPFAIADWQTGTKGIFVNTSSGDIGIGTRSPQTKLHVAGNTQVDGTVTTRVLTITGGADLAEPFEVSEDDIPKGAVVVIDDEHSGRLKISDRAYDNRVAGIISGANGVNPGIMLRQEGTLDGTQNVALTGRVYALADASESPIKPGDLLTTSATPGHCMKATDRELRDGAILGKAMTGLKEGQGHVLVLVNLQ